MKRRRVALAKILNERSYSDISMEMQAKIRPGRGLERTVEVIEEALKSLSRKPAHQAQKV